MILSDDEFASVLDGGVELELTLRGARQAISSTISLIEAVESVELSEDGEDTFVATVRMSTDQRESLIVALVGAGIGIRLISETRSELERIFLNLTKETAA